MKLARWLSAPEGRPFAALLLWAITGAQLAWCTLDLWLRYDSIVQGQAFRMRCQANGGSYGALRDDITMCFRRKNEAEAPETR